MKKGSVLFTSFLLVLVLSLLVGCSGRTSSNSEESSTETSTTEATASYPDKPVQLVFPIGAGGGMDTFARKFAQVAEKHLGQPIVVVNKGGAGGAIAIKEVLDQPADGYTIFGHTESIVYGMARGQMSYKLEDIEPVASIVSDMQGLVARPGEYETFEEFVEFAKENPGKAQITSSGMYSIGHILALAILKETELDGQYIAYESAPEAVRSLLSGNVHAATGPISAMLPSVKDGSQQLLSFTGKERLADAPDVPTFEEYGYNIDNVSIRGFSVKPGTPQEVIDVFTEVVKKVAEDPEWQEYLQNSGSNSDLKIGQEFKDALSNNYNQAIELFESIEE